MFQIGRLWRSRELAVSVPARRVSMSLFARHLNVPGNYLISIFLFFIFWNQAKRSRFTRTQQYSSHPAIPEVPITSIPTRVLVRSLSNASVLCMAMLPVFSRQCYYNIILAHITQRQKIWSLTELQWSWTFKKNSSKGGGKHFLFLLRYEGNRYLVEIIMPVGNYFLNWTKTV